MSSIVSEIDLEADGRHVGYLRLPHSVHRSAYGFIPIPIASVRNGEGPVVLLMAVTGLEPDPRDRTAMGAWTTDFPANGELSGSRGRYENFAN
jgi:hypothetical protein